MPAPGSWIRREPWEKAHRVARTEGRRLVLVCGATLESWWPIRPPRTPSPNDQCGTCRRSGFWALVDAEAARRAAERDGGHPAA